MEDLSLRIAPLGDYAWKDRRQTGQPVDMKPKSEREALIRELTVSPAQILLLRGLGSKASLLHVQQELLDAGVDYPEQVYIPGMTPSEGVGFLHKKSIKKSVDLSDQVYRIHEREYHPLAGGILLSTPTHPRLWIWNSRPPEPEESYERRRNDSRIVAQTLHPLIENGDQVLLSMHSREDVDSPMFRLLEETGLKRVLPVDERGDSWTHRDPEGILYRQDQWLFATPVLWESLQNRARVFDSADLRTAGQFRHQGVHIE
ncbi:MAG: hypothetical protein PF795_15305 [Kiritimatiellae bacterium]|nr:hypothetical protein [Kiritimatiellia bacterium]